MEQRILEFLQSRDVAALGLGELTVEVEIAVRGDESVWTITLDGGRFSVRAGASEGPGVIVRVHSEDVPRLLSGKLGADEALVAGRIEVSGDVGLAMQLAELLEQP